MKIKNNFIKSPLNYTGGKHKLLPQIIPLFPKNIDKFVDLFAGGGNVGVNVEANEIICNDIETHVIDFFKSISGLNKTEALTILKKTIDKYNLSKTNELGFKNIRADYNKGNRSWDMFYAMITNAFNYQIRYNKNDEYNMPFGRNRSSFNPKLEKTFMSFIDKLNSINISFTNEDYSTLINKLNLGENDIVYCDPPYLLSCATYNEQDGWNIEREKELLNLLDSLNKQGIKFALSNVLEAKGRSNELLKQWSKSYNVHYLNSDYSNCNYHIKDKSQKSVEVLITNY